MSARTLPAGDAPAASPAREHLRALRLAELELALEWLPPGARVLEIGAGAGWQAAELARRGFTVAAVDVAGSEYELDRIWPVEEYDGVELPFDDRGFGAVFSSNVLEHVTDLERLCREMRRVLEPRGVAVHALPSAAWRWWTTLALYAKLPWLWAGVARRQAAADPSRPAARRWRWIVRRCLRLAVPRGHGAHGGAWSEIYGFSRFAWRRRFERCGWRVVDYRSCRLFYTGYDLLGGRLPLRARRLLGYLLGSACALYLVRPRELDDEGPPRCAASPAT